MYHNVMWQVNQERHDELLKVAQAAQRTKMTGPETPSRKGRVLVNIGDLLINFGSKLKARYEPATQRPFG